MYRIPTTRAGQAAHVYMPRVRERSRTASVFANTRSCSRPFVRETPRAQRSRSRSFGKRSRSAFAFAFVREALTLSVRVRVRSNSEISRTVNPACSCSQGLLFAKSFANMERERSRTRLVREQLFRRLKVRKQTFANTVANRPCSRIHQKLHSQNHPGATTVT